VNYLELVKRLALEMGGELTERIESVATVPATSYGSSTEAILRCITWVQQAWLEIQDDQPNWAFMQAHGTCPLQLGQTTYDVAQAVEDDVGVDQFDGFIPYVASLDSRYVWVVNGNTDPLLKQPCYYIPPEHFFGYEDRVTTDKGRASTFSSAPDGCIVVAPAPAESGWYLEFDYNLKPQVLAADGDIPRLPEKFHMLIVYWAMVEYGDFDESERQFKRAWRNYRRMRNKLRLEQTREYTMPGTR